MNIDKLAVRKEPTWKRRFQNKIKEITKGLGQIEASKDKDISNFRHWERLNAAIEELKQRITAIAAKVRRYQGRVDSYRQNRLFEKYQRQFYGN